MFKKLPQLITTLLCCLFATTAAAADHSIHIEWGYTPPSDPPLSGFNLYQEGTLACSTNNPEATAMDCDVSLEKDTTHFTLTATFSDGSESPHSAPFPFSTLNDQTTESSTVDSEQVAKSSSGGTGSHSFTFNWESTSSAKSYRFYLNQELLCETEDPHALTITCNADLIDGLMTFSMTEISSLGIESSPSNLLLFDPTDYPTLFHPKQVQLTWEYPAEKNLKGFRVYQNNILLCETSNPAIRQLTCMANLTSPVVEFNITAVDTNNNETALSNTLTYTKEDQATNMVASALANESLSLADTSTDVSNALASESNDTTDEATVSDSALKTIQIQPLVYTTSLFADSSANTTLEQVTGTDNALPESTVQTSTTTSAQELPPFNLEVGAIDINAQWKGVALATPFHQPIVIAKSPSTSDFAAGAVHLRNITSTGFEIAYMAQDDTSVDDITIHYMVMEQGSYLLNQTTQVEAGSFSGNNGIEEITFATPFTTTPVVFTTLTTTNQTDTTGSQLLDINTNGFQHVLQTQETDDTRINETIHYIAWEQGNGALDTILYDAEITNAPLTGEADELTQQISFPEPTFFFPCALTSIDQETESLQSTTHPLPADTITIGYLAIAPPENETDK